MSDWRPELVRRIPRGVSLRRCALAAAMSIACGCQTEKVVTSDGWPLPPEPRSTPVTPVGIKADRMAFMVGSKPDDTDNNGYPDAIRTSVALFNDQYPTALREDGSFTFMLFRQGQSEVPGSEPFAQWRMDGDAVRRSEAMAQYGPCYQFTLSLLETPGGDRMPTERADMVCRFDPADGSTPVLSMGVRSLQIGAR